MPFPSGALALVQSVKTFSEAVAYSLDPTQGQGLADAIRSSLLVVLFLGCGALAYFGVLTLDPLFLGALAWAAAMSLGIDVGHFGAKPPAAPAP